MYDELIGSVFHRSRSYAVCGARLLTKQALYDSRRWRDELLRVFGDDLLIDDMADSHLTSVARRASTNPTLNAQRGGYYFPTAAASMRESGGGGRGVDLSGRAGQTSKSYAAHTGGSLVHRLRLRGPHTFCLSTLVSSVPARMFVFRSYDYTAIPPRMEEEDGGGDHRHSGVSGDVGVSGASSSSSSSSSAWSSLSVAVPPRPPVGTCKSTCVDALMATTAAPGFFPAVSLDTQLHADGALCANNPAAVALGEAKRLFPGVPVEALVSVGTGRLSEAPRDGRVGRWEWLVNQLIHSATDTEGVHHVLQEFLPVHR
eukprot:GHVU01020390.1.p1 GENE.GHVU01020390.1~~GHVU01020390.1.p1  ORF type:complete len:315 (-),score=44.47 GHVU01020390.1:316-1260(-)